jgi:Cd2+/Zn2+-exporting ATPase
MDCPSCAQKVEKSLQRIDGLYELRLQPTTGAATVTYDTSRTTERDIIDRIEAAGYDVLGGDSESEGPSDGVDMAPPSEIWTTARARKTWIGAALVVLGLVFEFLLTGQNVEVATVLDVPLEISDVVFLGAVAASGVPVIRGGYYSAKNLSLDIDLLMGTAIIAATGIGYFIEAATLAVLFSIAELLEEFAMDRARDSLRELMELSPDEATVLREAAATGGSEASNGASGERERSAGREIERSEISELRAGAERSASREEVTVPTEDVALGETVVIRPGEKVPLDGAVTDGESAVDQSPITGESVPVDKTVGDEVYAGSINEKGYLEVEVRSTAGDSTLSRIIEMVQGAQTNKTETEQFVDRFAGYYTPLVVVLAMLTAAIPPLLLSDTITVDVAGYGLVFAEGWRPWFIRGLTLLVIACPCAFVISTPVSVVSGITNAAKNGVLIKGGDHLEATGEVDAVALDKTGTLTKGELAVTDLVPFGEHNESTLLRYAVAVEQRSEHPIADAIVSQSEESDIEDLPNLTDFESLTGKGVRADIDISVSGEAGGSSASSDGGETYYAGKPARFTELGFDLSRPATDGGVSAAPEPTETGVGDTLAALEREGKTVVLVGTESELLGAIAIADEVRPAAKHAVERLHDLGVEHVVMLTGDNEGTARAIAEKVGIDEYRAELLPEGKVEAIEQLQAERGTVAMVGDGINDAPALATADVSVAMGAAGTDTALETADIALMGDDIGKLPYLYALSHTANGVIRQSIWASLAVKFLLALGVPLGLVSVAVAVVVGDMGMSLGVTGNAMRLSRIEPERFFDS